MDVGLHSPHSTEVHSGRDNRNVVAQDAREAIIDHADDGLAGVNVLIYPIFGVQHLLDFTDWDGGSHPVTSIHAREE